ncbi:hypothetical protein [Nocardia jejuensis]|nr:hypothetical protein [Nocardia jejuensis]
MKQFLFLTMAVVIAGSTYGYAKSPSPYPVVVLTGVVLALLLFGRYMR